MNVLNPVMKLKLITSTKELQSTKRVTLNKHDYF